MTLLQFECKSCKKQFETLVKEGEKPRCPVCGGEVKQAFFGTCNGGKSSACSGNCATCSGCKH